jgi:hypothetical protein
MSIVYKGVKIKPDLKTNKKDLVYICFEEYGEMINLIMQVLFVTPDMAKEFLTKNGSNRNLSQDRVKLWSGLINKMKWYPLNFLVFDPEGNLRDGQHRLNSIIKSGMGAYCIAFGNVPIEWLTAIDTGRPRTFQDISKVAYGKDYTKRHLPLAKYLEMGLSVDKNRKNLSMDDGQELVSKWIEPITFTLENSKNIRGVTAPALYAIARSWYSMDTNRLVEFLSVVKSGVVVTSKDVAAIKFRDFIREPIKTSETGGIKEVYFRTLTAIYDFNKGVGHSVPKLTLEQLEEKFIIPNMGGE